MSIAIATPSPLVQGILHAASHVNTARVLTAVSALEAAFYFSLQGGLPNANKTIQYIRETTIAHFSSIQALFNLANAGMVALSLKKLDDALAARYSFSMLDLACEKARKNQGAIVLAALASMVGFIYWAWKRPPLAIEGNPNEVLVTETHSTQQKVTAFFHGIKIGMYGALAYFSGNRLAWSLGIAAEVYSGWKNKQLTWKHFSKVFQFQPAPQEPRIDRVKVTYHMLQLPALASSVQEQCVFCLNQNGVAKVAFCANHVFHKHCIKQAIQEKSDQFNTKSKFLRTATPHYRNGAYTHTSYSYSVSVPTESLSSHPACRDVPLHNECSFFVSDQDKGVFEASVTIERLPIDRESLFSNLYAVYNVVQAGLAYLQHYPELAPTIFKIQQVFLVLDSLGYLFTLHFISKKYEDKISPVVSKIATVSGGVVLAALSYYAVLKVSPYVRSTTVLNAAVAAEGLKGAQLKWEAPVVYRFMQALSIARLVASAALSFFSEKINKAHLLSMSAQAFTIGVLFRLHWLKFSQALSYPLEKILAEGGKHTSSLSVHSLKELQMDAYFMVPSACVQEPSHLQASLKPMGEYMSKLLDKSAWDRYWHVIYRNGVEVSRKLVYTVKLQAQKIGACTCSLFPYLGKLYMQAKDVSYGAAKVVVN